MKNKIAKRPTLSLYPNILFHFTSKEKRYSIRNETFKVSYARESIVGGSVQREFGVPMISFCDLRLSELKYHIHSYGRYGIGMTKDWAFRNGLNPVLYVSQSSNFTEGFLTALGDLFKMVNNANDTDGRYSKAYNNAMNTLRYIKNYKGTLKRPGKRDKPNHLFADEREWRYVPPFSEDFAAFIPIEKIADRFQKAKHNSRIGHLSLRFQPDDIKYLIVDNDDEINPLIQHLRYAKDKFPPTTVDRLSSRILTFKQIEEDV